MTNSEGVKFLQTDVERFCGELVGLAPAVRLRLVTELRAALDEVTTAALTAGMVAAKQEGWGLRRIARVVDLSHEQVRRMLASSPPAGSDAAAGPADERPAPDR